EWHQEFEYDLLGWLQSALNSLLPVPNVFFSSLTGKPRKTGKLNVFISFGLGVALSALALPAVAIGTLTKRGGTLVVVARQVNGK
ncbi:MAG: class I SAM-dependent methyltransferase, partial [Blastocatellia bacterium]